MDEAEIWDSDSAIFELINVCTLMSSSIEGG